MEGMCRVIFGSKSEMKDWNRDAFVKRNCKD